jgi:hypothetical protein
MDRRKLALDVSDHLYVRIIFFFAVADIIYGEPNGVLTSDALPRQELGKAGVGCATLGQI